MKLTITAEIDGENLRHDQVAQHVLDRLTNVVFMVGQDWRGTRLRNIRVDVVDSGETDEQAGG